MSKQTKLQTKKTATTTANASQTDAQLMDDSPLQAQVSGNTQALIFKVSERFNAAMEEKLSKFSETLD